MLFIFLPPSNISAIAFGITFGLLWLATVPATNGIVAQVFGAKNLSMLFGIVFLNHQIGSFLGAYLVEFSTIFLGILTTHGILR